MKLLAKRMHELAVLPKRAHPDDAGLDLCSVEAMRIEPGRSAKVSTGLALEIYPGFYGALKPRSSVFMRGLVCDCVVDAGYRGIVYMGFVNTSLYAFDVKIGDRLAQLLVLPVAALEVVEAEELSETERGTGGFGSSDRPAGSSG